MFRLLRNLPLELHLMHVLACEVICLLCCLPHGCGPCIYSSLFPTLGAAVVQHLMSELIREHNLLFSRENCNPPETSLQAVHPIQRHSNLVEWVDEPPAHLREPLLSKDNVTLPDQTATCLRKHSLPITTERRGSFQSPCEKNFNNHLSDTEDTSPTSSTLIHDNQSQQSLAQECLHTSTSTPPLACSSMTKVLKAGVEIYVQSRSWPDMEEPSWSPERALGESRGSSEVQDSTLSVYDNIVTEEQGERYTEDKEAKGAASVAESSSSWSSCEIVPLDGGSGSGGAASPCHGSPGQFPSFRMDSGEEDLRPNSPASSSAPTDAPLSTGSSEVFLPNAPQEPLGFPASHAMQCLVSGLRQQMTRQKAEYEAKINR